METNSEIKQNMVSFFRKLATDIEEDTIPEERLRSISEFYICYLFMQQLQSVYEEKNEEKK